MMLRTIAILLSFGAVCINSAYAMDDETWKEKKQRIRAEREEMTQRNGAKMQAQYQKVNQAAEDYKTVINAFPQELQKIRAEEAARRQQNQQEIDRMNAESQAARARLLESQRAFRQGL